MKFVRSGLWLLAPLLAGCATMDETGPIMVGQSSLLHADGTSAGLARLYRSNGETILSVALTGFERGAVLSVGFEPDWSCDIDGIAPHTLAQNEGPPAWSGLDHEGFREVLRAQVGDAGRGTTSAILPTPEVGDSTRNARWPDDQEAGIIVVMSGAPHVSYDAASPLACGQIELSPIRIR